MCDDTCFPSLFPHGLRPFLAVQWLRRFDPRSVHVGFVVDKVTLGQVFPRVIRFSPVSFTPPALQYLEKDKK
jgi:hypothetical protein